MREEEDKLIYKTPNLPVKAKKQSGGSKSGSQGLRLVRKDCRSTRYVKKKKKRGGIVELVRKDEKNNLVCLEESDGCRKRDRSLLLGPVQANTGLYHMSVLSKHAPDTVKKQT